MTQEQCDNCACVEKLKIVNKTCKEAAEKIYITDPDAICEDFKEKLK